MDIRIKLPFVKREFRPQYWNIILWKTRIAKCPIFKIHKNVIYGSILTDNIAAMTSNGHGTQFWYQSRMVHCGSSWFIGSQYKS